MNQQDRQILFHSALAGIQGMQSSAGDNRILTSIANQLVYLGDVAAGVTPPDRLAEIIIGVQTAREIDGWDDNVAALLYACAAEAKAMQLEESLAGVRIEPKK